MNILLDTHVLIWWMQGSDRLGSRAKAEMFDPGARLWLSAASVWEIAIKRVAGRLTLDTTRWPTASCPRTTAIPSIEC